MRSVNSFIKHVQYLGVKVWQSVNIFSQITLRPPKSLFFSAHQNEIAPMEGIQKLCANDGLRWCYEKSKKNQRVVCQVWHKSLTKFLYFSSIFMCWQLWLKITLKWLALEGDVRYQQAIVILKAHKLNFPTKYPVFKKSKNSLRDNI